MLMIPNLVWLHNFQMICLAALDYMPRRRRCWVIDGVSFHPTSCTFYACRCMFRLDCTIQGCKNEQGGYYARKLCVRGLSYIVGRNKYFHWIQECATFFFFQHWISATDISVYRRIFLQAKSQHPHVLFSRFKHPEGRLQSGSNSSEMDNTT